MKKRWLACIMSFLMLSSVFLFSACDFSESGDTDPKLQSIIDANNNGVDFNSFTYTYFDEDGRALLGSAFKEAYVFVDPGSEALYYDNKTDSSVSFADLVEREADTIAENLAHRLIATYGSHITSNVVINQQIIEGADSNHSAEILESIYNIKFDSSDSLGDNIKESTSFNEEVLIENDPIRYYLDDKYMLSLLMGIKNIIDTDFSEGNLQTIKDDLNTLKQYFLFDEYVPEGEEAIDVVIMSGAGFNFTINNKLEIIKATADADNLHQWEIYNTLGSVDLEGLKEELKNLVLDVKSGLTTDSSVVDHLGFTTNDLQKLKELIVERIIGEENYDYDNECLSAIIMSSSNNTSDLGAYVTLNKDDLDNIRINGTSEFEIEYQNIKDVFASGVSDLEKTEAYEAFIANVETQNYLKMFDYKGYELALDAMINGVFTSPQYINDGENDISVTNENLYPLFPRIQVMIVPGIYLGGEYDESMEEDLEEDEEGNYDYQDMADKSGYDPTSEPVTTMEPYLPSWKIISIVYKPGDYYGVNNVTDVQIDGVIVPDMDIAFVGEVGYTSIVESTVTYMADGNKVLSAGEIFVSDELVDDICPDMTASEYPDNHYLTLFDLINTKPEDLDRYVLSGYNGVDLRDMASENDKIKLGKITTTDGSVYYEQVDGLPVDESFLTLVETETGPVISMPGLGDNYLKLDINFNKITDVNRNDITAVKKRTELGIITIEPHTAS